MKADKIYLGNVITMDEKKPYAEAVVVKDGLIQYVGSEIIARSMADGKDYPGSEALCMLDIVQSLKWINENIAAFRGNPDNITVCGESAGGGAVSMLCIMPEAKGLFEKAIPISGSVSQFNDISRTVNQIPALREEFGV